MNSGKPTVGVSACLLGERVRYDGGHRHEPLVTAELAETFRLVPLCPEVEVGFGIPRPPIQLVRGDAGIRLETVEGGEDLTERMEGLVRSRLETLDAQGICGFVLKARSPSCGLESTPIHDATGHEIGTGSGLFAVRVEASWPDLPVIDEEGLRDPEQRRRFVAAVTARFRRRSAEQRSAP